MSTPICDLPNSTYLDKPVQQTAYSSAAAPPPQVAVPYKLDDGNTVRQQQHQQQQQQQQRLPTRDIPIDKEEYMHDEQIVPNYIPKPTKRQPQHNYVDEQEKLSAAIREKHRKKKWREYTLDDLFSEIYVPLFLAILFYIFQLNFIEKVLYKYLPNMVSNVLFDGDANLTFAGSVTKSILFGATFYCMIKTQNLIVSYF